jgi:hypothetical protein
MLHPRGGWLAVMVALLCAGCVVASATPNPPTAALITATALDTPTAPPASSTAISIVTATTGYTPPAGDTLPASPTPLPGTSQRASDTPPPSQASSTPFASETSTTVPGSAGPPTPTLPAATVPPQASALAVGITSFSISPQTIKPGDAITLTWQATGQQAAIYRQDPRGPLTDMRTVPLSGTLTIQTSSDLRNRVDYVLYAGAGASSASATVSAVIRCPDPYFFANPPAGCPSFPGTLEPMAAERFEHGVMIWESSNHQITVLFGDQAVPKWESLNDTWAQGQPETDPNLTPPAGLFQPVRGFGLIWRSNDPGSGQTVRARLGWATEAEAALTGAFQCDSTPKYSNCFISGPAGAVYELGPEFSAWKVWAGP